MKAPGVPEDPPLAEGAGAGGAGAGAGARLFTDTGCCVTAIGLGTLDQLETKLLKNGAILGVMGRLVGRVVADHAFLAVFMATNTPVQDVGAERARHHGII